MPNNLLPANRAIIYWTPETDQVAVFPHPDPYHRPYECNDLASWVAVRTLTRAQLIEVVHAIAFKLVGRDHCDPAAVHAALMQIEEYASTWDQIPRTTPSRAIH